MVHSQRAGLKFGVSPFGIYMPGVPAGIQAGVNQYEQLYGDPVKWMRERMDRLPCAATVLARWRTTELLFAAALVAQPAGKSARRARLARYRLGSLELARMAFQRDRPPIAGGEIGGVSLERRRDLLEHQGAA